MSKFSSKREKVRASTSETRQEYAAEEAKYFGAMGDAKRPGLSAADAAVADRHLPSKEAEHKMLERWEKGLTKSSRSGAFSKPGSGPAIFPNSLKFASKFIDECTPGQYKEQKERPVLREQTRRVDAPPSEFTKLDMCIDCLQPIDTNDAPSITPSLFFIRTMDTTKLFSMGLTFAAPVIMAVHTKCEREAQRLGQDATKLVLVHGGSITDPDELARAFKYGQVLRMHDGHELTAGQWHLQKRKDRLEATMVDILICMDKRSECYRRNRVKAENNV